MKSKEYYEHERTELITLIPSSAKRILDVGCGSGMLGRALRNKNNALYIEGIEVVQDIIPGSYYDKVHIGDVESIFPLILASGKMFDCIIFADVLEHLVNPWKMVEISHDLLVNDGVVIASIPNVRYYYVLKQLILQGDWSYEQEGIMDQTHIRFFTLKTMRSMFESKNYSIISCVPIRYRPKNGWKKIIDRLFSLSHRFQDINVFQFIIVARKNRFDTKDKSPRNEF